MLCGLRSLHSPLDGIQGLHRFAAAQHRIPFRFGCPLPPPSDPPRNPPPPPHLHPLSVLARAHIHTRVPDLHREMLGQRSKELPQVRTDCMKKHPRGQAIGNWHT